MNVHHNLQSSIYQFSGSFYRSQVPAPRTLRGVSMAPGVRQTVSRTNSPVTSNQGQCNQHLIGIDRTRGSSSRSFFKKQTGVPSSSPIVWNLDPLTSDLHKKVPSPIFPRSTPLQCQRQCSPGPGAWRSSSPGFHRDPGRWPNRTCCLAENEPEKVARHGNMYPLKMGI